MLDNVMKLIADGVFFLGGAIAIWGLISLGMTIKDGMQGGGGQLATSIAFIVGGAIICAASVLFGVLDTTWSTI